jgi:hypothetical protein
MDNNSEVANLLLKIDSELSACRSGVTGLAIVARHDFIQARMEGVQRAHERLETLLSVNEAIEMVAARMEQYS